MKNTISFVGCFTIVWNVYDNTLHVVLVQRKDKPVWELPGGGLEPQDVVEGQNPFENCAIRELLEETGLVLDRRDLKDEAVLAQRVAIGNHSIGAGTVFLYSNMHKALRDLSENNVFVSDLQSFRSDETAQVLVTPIDRDFFIREDVSLATKRMIGILMKRINTHQKHFVVHSALSLSVYIPQFRLDV